MNALERFVCSPLPSSRTNFAAPNFFFVGRIWILVTFAVTVCGGAATVALINAGVAAATVIAMAVAAIAAGAIVSRAARRLRP